MERAVFHIKDNVHAHHHTPVHDHPELELHYVKQGSGIRHIGNVTDEFFTGELILLGEELPHCWTQHRFTRQTFGTTVVHFLPDCLGYDLLGLPEALPLARLFNRAKYGMLISGQTKEKLIPLLGNAVSAIGMDKIAILISMLCILATSTEYELISPEKFAGKGRMENIIRYTKAHYQENISLKDIAAQSHLSITSFCRYFKSRTKKPYSVFLTEIRIGHACRLLLENKLKTEAVCFESGFNNLANFYRQFKRMKGCTPKAYRAGTHALFTG